MVTINVDGKEIKAKDGDILLQVCLDNDIYIPNLCYLKDRDREAASCRLCFVEIKGAEKPLPACTVRIKDDLVVQTATEKVRALQLAAFKLLMSTHDVDCKACPANKKCPLQDTARFLKTGLNAKPLPRYLEKQDIDRTHPVLNYYPNRCVLCGKCIDLCRDEHGKKLLTFSERGFNTVISFYGAEQSNSSACKECRKCVDICPVAAILLKTEDDSQTER